MRLSHLNSFGTRLTAQTKPARLTEEIGGGISVDGKPNVFPFLPSVAHRWLGPDTVFNKRFSDVENHSS